MSETKKPRPWPKTRWTVAVLLVLGGIAIAALDIWHICAEEIASIGDEPVVEVCHPPGPLDLPIVLGFFLVLLLLWPDLSALGVGPLKMERRTEPKDMPESEIRTVAREARDEQARTAASEELASLDAVPALRFETTDTDRVSPTIEDFLATWAVTESILSWRDNAQQRLAHATPERVIHPPLRPLLGVKIPQPKEQAALDLIEDALRPQRNLVTAARSARNLMVHSAEVLEDDVLDPLTEGLTRIHGGIRLSLARLIRQE